MLHQYYWLFVISDLITFMTSHCWILRTKTTRTTTMPAFWGYPPPPSHDYPYYWVILAPKLKEDKVKVINSKNLPTFFNFWSKLYTWHTFWSCLIRCANMKWIWWVLLKIQSGQDYLHRRTDGQGETNILFQIGWSSSYNHHETH